MAFHCVNCNGSMVFDVASQQMKCLHCGSVCAPEDFVFHDESPEARAQQLDDELAHFSCQNCGAELEATEDSLIGLCPYCGGQSMVRTAGATFDVEGVVPFGIDKDRCVELYANYAKGVRYLPRELKDPEFIQSFTGIYMPFYQYDVDVNSAAVTGQKTVVSNSRYDEVAYYKVGMEVEGTYERGVVYDGSKYLDDQISARVQPFDLARQVPFNPAYLAGFYADASTVKPELYYKDAAEQAAYNLVEAASYELRRSHGITVSGNTSHMDVSTTKHHQVLLPLWFLTWRKKDRVAYAVINGESGEVVSDLPLDMRSFGVGCAIVSAVVFALLELLVQPTPLITSLVSLVGACFMAWGLAYGARREYEHHTHANDKGWSQDEGDEPEDEKAPKAKKKRRKRKRKKEKIGFFDVFLWIMMAIWAFFLVRSVGALANKFGGILSVVVAIAAVGYTVYNCTRVLSWRKVIARTDVLVSTIVLLVTVALNMLIVAVRPVNDGWYYLGDAICILGLVVVAIGMIRLYNVGTTRPLPKLFDRQEVEQ